MPRAIVPSCRECWRQTTQPLILIQDGARYHTAAKTQAFFATHAERLMVMQLPSYSPDYNPIEHCGATSSGTIRITATFRSLAI